MRCMFARMAKQKVPDDGPDRGLWILIGLAVMLGLGGAILVVAST